MIGWNRRWLLVMGWAAVTACSDTSGGSDGACTASFAIHTVRIEDGAGSPVSGASVTAVLARTGEVLQPTTLSLMTEGVYVVVDDGSTHLIRRQGDQVDVRVTSGSASRDLGYVFATDGCHVNKVSGPDTVTLE